MLIIMQQLYQTVHAAAFLSLKVVKLAFFWSGHARVAVIGVGGLGWWAIQFLKVLYPDNLFVVAVDTKVKQPVSRSALPGEWNTVSLL